MIRLLFCIISAIALLGTASQAAASEPPVEGAFTYHLPDASTVEVALRGDADGHYYLTPDGYPALPDRAGYLYYAVTKGDKLVATKIKLASATRKLSLEQKRYLASLNRPALVEAAERRNKQLAAKARALRNDTAAVPELFGRGAVPVIIVEFKDVRFAAIDPAAALRPVLRDAAAKLDSASHGLFAPQFEIVGRARLDKRRAHYGIDTPEQPDSRRWEAVTDAVTLIRKSGSRVDFDRFDSDGDGFVDRLLIIYAGSGQEDGAIASALWSRSDNLLEGNGISLEPAPGLRIGRYNLVASVNTDGSPAGSDALCNALVAPGAATPGRTFSPDAPTRAALGWLAPHRLTHPESTIFGRGMATEAATIPLAGSSQLLLSTSTAPDGTPAVDARFTDSRFRTLRSALLDASAIASGEWLATLEQLAGEALPLDNLRLSNGAAAVDYRGGGEPLPAVELLEPTAVEADGATIGWLPVAGADRYEVIVSAAGRVGREMTIAAPAGAQSVHIEGLAPASDYTATVTAYDQRRRSADSRSIAFTTLPATFDMLRAEALEPTDVDSAGFTANWLPVADAEAYLIEVYEKLTNMREAVTLGFGGTYPMPERWSSRGCTVKDVNGFFGSGRNAMRMIANGSYIASDRSATPISEIEFWTRAEGVGRTLSIEGYSRGRWIHLATTAVTAAYGGEMVRLAAFGQNPMIPQGGVTAVRIVAGGESPAPVWIDDLTVVRGMPHTLRPVATYGLRNVGNTLATRINGLAPLTTYYYRVSAIDSGDTTAVSNEIAVTTPMPRSVAAAEAAVVSLAESGVTITPTSDGVAIDNPGEATVSAICATADGALLRRIKIRGGSAVTIALPHNGLYIISCADASLKLLR